MSFLKSIWKKDSKHKKLSEELGLKNAKEIEAKQLDAPEADKDVMTFKLKYLGNTVVEKGLGDSISNEAVKNIMKVAKASGKKLPRVNVAVSLKGIKVTDAKDNDMFEISVYKISNCSTDKSNRQVFSFIAIDASDSMECHAFWCSKRKMAEMVALTVAHAFSTAYETWRLSPNVSEFEKNGGFVEAENMKNTLNNMKTNIIENELMDMKNESEQITEEKLINFDDEPVTAVGIKLSYTINGTAFDDMNAKNQWVCFEDDFASSFHDDLESSFPNELDCDFSKSINKMQCGIQNNLNEPQWRNNANPIDFFLS